MTTGGTRRPTGSGSTSPPPTTSKTCIASTATRSTGRTSRRGAISTWPGRWRRSSRATSSGRPASATGACAPRPTGRVIGLAGCARQEGAPWWNLYYRFDSVRPRSWVRRRGGAARVGRCRRRRPGPPGLAYLLEHNVASRRTRGTARTEPGLARTRRRQRGRHGDQAGLPGPRARRRVRGQHGRHAGCPTDGMV